MNDYISIHELTEDTCRYPMAEKPASFCGKEVYKKFCCKDHFIICFRQKD